MRSILVDSAKKVLEYTVNVSWMSPTSNFLLLKES
jgi:hypothetical protein